MHKLHLGCGSIILPGWINIDLDSPQADLRMNLCDQLPYPDGTVEFIFAEHFIEHISRNEALALLKECCRVLSPEGVIRLSTPNLQFLIHSYARQDISQWGDLWLPKNSCHMMNEAMRSWGHQFVYDNHELHELLIEAGFNSVRNCHWRLSEIPELDSLESRPFHNELIAEASKTALQNNSLSDPIVYFGEGDSHKGVIEIDRLIEIRKLKQHIEDCNKHIVGFEQSVADKDRHIAFLEKDVVDKGVYIEESRKSAEYIQSVLQAQDAKIKLIEQSFCFRVSTKVKKLIAQLRKSGSK